ncbi:alkylphosphocholine resistance protein lem3 [Tilletia horrida]|uniref:Alkylphosphocholine resistance protein lem3 n=1 Tax=Tilletia horrida TaxID=155126 RepID=A0AAN6JSZ2_9BASI|nr:alkylphosphocholine resistance protein lem3 [Tilletia horrida]
MAPSRRRQRERSSGSTSSSSNSLDGDDHHHHANSRKKKKNDTHHARRPPMSAWRAQKLPAWQPLMTPKTTISVLFLTGLIIAPIGAVIFYFSLRRDYIAFDYTACRTAATASPADMPPASYTYQIDDSAARNTSYPAPQWAYVPNDAAPAGSACRLLFTLPQAIPTPVLLAYRLTNFHQNHRKYVKGVDTDQMKGDAVAPASLETLCRPFSQDPQSGKAIYPCGLIANSIFNDTFSDPIIANPDGSLTMTTFPMAESNLVLAADRKKYAVSRYNPADVVPPPFWRGSTKGPYGYAAGYSDGSAGASNDSRPLFDPTKDEHFMVWMNTAALPNFEKLYKRSDTTPMGAGRYAIEIFDNWPVDGFKGTKSLVLTTAAWNGSRNLLLGLVTLGAGGLCLILALVFTARHVIKPRKLGQFK